jgi:TolB protein
MSESMNSVDAIFEMWLVDGPDRGPAAGLEAALAATREVRQRPPWTVADWWRPASWDSSMRSRTVAITLLVIALAATVLVATLVGSSRRLPLPFGLAGNGRIVYDTGIGGEVFLANADGTNPLPIPGEGIGRRPIFSPDGAKLAFWTRPAVGQAGQNGSNNALLFPFHLYVANADGSDPHAVAGGRTFRLCCPSPVAWSPDSQSIAFLVWDPNADETWIIPVDGRGPAGPLISNGSHHLGPSWSPDGRWIAFVEDTPSDALIHKIVVMHPDGTDRRVLHRQRSIDPDEPTFGGALQWAPDSTRLAYVRGADPDDPTDPPHAGLLEVVGLDGGERRVMTETSGWLNDLSWSPDGRSLAVMVGDPSTSIRVVDVATGDSRPIARCSVHYDAPLRWSPDGRYLIDDCPDAPGLYRADATDYLSAPAVALPSSAAEIDIQRVAP